MVIIVGNSRIYRFLDSTCEVYDGHAEILVLPERRRFVLRLKEGAKDRLQAAYPQRTPQQILTTLIANALKDGWLQVDEEVQP
jgi:hypothetical protein